MVQPAGPSRWCLGLIARHQSPELAIPDSEMENPLFGLMGEVGPPQGSKGKVVLIMDLSPLDQNVVFSAPWKGYALAI